MLIKTSSLSFFALFLTYAFPAAADPVVLNISGLVTTSTSGSATLGAGSYTQAQLTAAGSAVGTVTSGGLTGVSVWSLLGGTTAGTSDVSIPIPSGDNAKNSILHSFLLATSTTGAQSILSLGEIDPFFGGTGATPDFISFSGSNGQPELVFPGSGASGRNVVSVASLQVMAAPALPSSAGGVSTSLSLSGSVASPGTYNLAALQALPSVTQTVSGDTYTGVPLWTFLGSTASNPLNGYVVAAGTDGYEAVYSLAELDPAFGAAANLLPYADNGGQFPGDGLARVVTPGDNHQGRWVSNVDFIAVTAVPEPAFAWLIPFFALALYVAVRQWPACAASTDRSRRSASGLQ